MNKSTKQIMENLKKNSIGEDKKNKLKDLKIRTLLVSSTLSLTLLFTFLSTSCSPNLENYNPEDNFVTEEKSQYESNRDYNYDYDTQVVDRLIYDEADRVNMKFVFSNVEIMNNSIEEYQKVNGLSEEDLIGFYTLVKSNTTETEKVIKALGYDDWNDYLIKNNYIDENGLPSVVVWRCDEKQRLFDEYQQKYSKGL